MNLVEELDGVVVHDRPESRVRNPSRAHVWLCCSEDADERAFMLSAEERARATRFRREADRRRYVVRHVLARRILAGFVRRPPEALVFRTGRCGKPHLAVRDGRREERLTAVDFSVAYSEETLAMVVATGRAVGIDLEIVRPIVDPVGIAATQFPPALVRELAELPPRSQELAFYRMWTRKEAFTKMQGRGLDCRHAGGPLGVRRWTLQSFSAAQGSVALVGALAMENNVDGAPESVVGGPTPSELPSPWAAAPWSRTSGSVWPAARSARSTACRSS